MSSIPQADLTWFPSQIFWTLVLFGLLYVLNLKLILPNAEKRASTKKALLDKLDKEIQNMLEHIKKFREDMRDLELLEQKERNALTDKLHTRENHKMLEIERVHRLELEKYRDSLAEKNHLRISSIRNDPAFIKLLGSFTEKLGK